MCTQLMSVKSEVEAKEKDKAKMKLELDGQCQQLNAKASQQQLESLNQVIVVIV